MSNLPITRPRALEIPLELYEELNLWCNNPEIHHSATLPFLKWRELPLTQKFEETHLGYTQERLDRVLRAFNCYQNAAINIAQVNIKVGFIGRQVFLTTSNDIGSGLHPSLRSFCPQKVIRRRAGLIFLKRSCLQ